MSKKKSRKFTGRTRARSRAVDTLFEADQRGFGSTPDRIKDLARARQVVSTAQTGIPPYAYEIVVGVAEHVSEIDEAIAANATNWTIDRMPGVDLAILRVGAWEILFNPEIDGPIAIKEAMNIAEVIASEKTPAFVNAILDRINKVAKARSAVFGSTTVPEDFGEGIDLPDLAKLPAGSVLVDSQDANPSGEGEQDLGQDRADSPGGSYEQNATAGNEPASANADASLASPTASLDAPSQAGPEPTSEGCPSNQPDAQSGQEQASANKLDASEPSSSVRSEDQQELVAQALAILAAGDYIADQEEE